MTAKRAVDEKAFGKEILCGSVGAIALLRSRLEMFDIFSSWRMALNCSVLLIAAQSIQSF